MCLDTARVVRLYCSCWKKDGVAASPEVPWLATLSGVKPVSRAMAQYTCEVEGFRFSRWQLPASNQLGCWDASLPFDRFAGIYLYLL